MARLASPLPDPMIRSVPATGRACGDLTEEALHDRVELGRGVVAAGGGEYVPVHVELPLLPSSVSDPDRLAARESLQVLEACLSQDPFPLHTEDGLRVAVGAHRHGRRVPSTPGIARPRRHTWPP